MKKIWTEKDNKAFTIISLTIKDDQIRHIQACTSAKEAWDKLSAIHEGIGTTGKMVLRQRLVSTRLENGGRLQEHLDLFRTIASQMKTLGDEIKDDELMNWLFISLPKSFEPMVMALQAQPTLTFYFVTTRLIQEETRRMAKDHRTGQGTTAGSEVETALSTTAANGGKRGGKKGGKQSEKKPGECHHYGKKGHWKRECRKRKAEEEESIKKPTDKVSVVFTAFAANPTQPSATPQLSELSKIWNIDSGASYHITTNRH